MPVQVSVIGHGKPGSIKVGEDRLAVDGVGVPTGPGNIEKFATELNGKISALYLVGCETARGAKGRELLRALSRGLGDIPVHGWTERIYAYGHYQDIPPARRNSFVTFNAEKRHIPAASQWGMGVIVLLLLTGFTVKFGRRRAANTGNPNRVAA